MNHGDLSSINLPTLTPEDELIIQADQDCLLEDLPARVGIIVLIIESESGWSSGPDGRLQHRLVSSVPYYVE